MRRKEEKSMKPTYTEVIKLVEETQAAATAYHNENERSKITPFGPKEIIALEKLAVKSSELNKMRKEVLALFTPEELSEIKKLAQK